MRSDIGSAAQPAPPPRCVTAAAVGSRRAAARSCAKPAGDPARDSERWTRASTRSASTASSATSSAAADHLRVVLLGEAVVDEPAEPAERRRTPRSSRWRSPAASRCARRRRSAAARWAARPGAAPAARSCPCRRGVARGRVDVLHAGVGVGQDRRDREQHQHDLGRDQVAASVPPWKCGAMSTHEQDEQADGRAARAGRWRRDDPACPGRCARCSRPSGSAMTRRDHQRDQPSTEVLELGRSR